jgi:hypothetical protein
MDTGVPLTKHNLLQIGIIHLNKYLKKIAYNQNDWL